VLAVLAVLAAKLAEPWLRDAPIAPDEAPASQSD